MTSPDSKRQKKEKASASTHFDSICNEARGLALDAVVKCKSGHLGLPLGATEIGAALWGNFMRFNPSEPKWLNRDIFVLSAGHGSMFLYGWLHLTGYLKMEDVQAFRSLGSITPGHPEFHETPGVEATTGPLGQGIGNAVGYAVSCKMAAAKFNTDAHTIVDNKVIALAGDGCLQEGVAFEAIAFAGHFRLDNLILLFDSNDVTLDAMADATQSESHVKRMEALGWQTQTVRDGHNVDAITNALNKARASKTGKPQFIEVRTTIGKGISEVEGTQKAHGEGGTKFADAARAGWGLPADQKFFVSEETRKFFEEVKARQLKSFEEWTETFNAWKEANPSLAAELNAETPSAEKLLEAIPHFAADAALATRAAGRDVLQPVAAAVPNLIGGSADLYGSTLNYIQGSPDFSRDEPSGRNIRFGIREHGMGAILNGIAYHGLFRPSGATFLVFADYCRPSIRLAALSSLPVVYIFTHDSVGVGEDGPTHQPVETVSGLRVIPNLTVIRPADPEETAAAFAAAVARTSGPTLLALSRQAVPNLTETASVQTRREGALKGGYVLKKESGALQTILMATGSEVSLAVKAAEALGDGVRVVSMPSFELFDAQSQEYRDSVLPPAARRRVSVEAGVSDSWYKYLGFEGKSVAINRFGLSAPGGICLKERGMTVENIVAAVKSL